MRRSTRPLVPWAVVPGCTQRGPYRRLAGGRDAEVLEPNAQPSVAPIWRVRRQNGANVGMLSRMPSIQVKDVPEDVHATLRQRASAARMSLQEYLLGRLIEEAHTPTLEEVLDRAGGRAGGRAPLAKAAKAVRADRDAR